MTPIPNPVNEGKQRYNTSHASARNIVEMTFGRLKNKFKCLHKQRTLHYTPKVAANIIIACCVLYNKYCDVFPDYEDEEGDDEHADGRFSLIDFLIEGNNIRNLIIYNYFLLIAYFYM